MKEKRKKIYYCHQCKKIFHDGEEAIIIEHKRMRSFCSEKCILLFFDPIAKHLDQEEINLRHKLDLEGDFILESDQMDFFIEKALQGPCEVLPENDPLAEDVTFFIAQFMNDGDLESSPDDNHKKKFYLIFSGLIFEDGLSFIFWQTTTRSEEFVAYFRSEESEKQNKIKISQHGQNQNQNQTQVQNLDSPSSSSSSSSLSSSNTSSSSSSSSSMMSGEKISPDSKSLASEDSNSADTNDQEIIMDEKDVFELDQKRNGLLNKLINERSQFDIPLEHFSKYESFMQNTLDTPDEVYRSHSHEEAGDHYFTYIKTFQIEHVSFFYIVLCMHYQTDLETGEETLIPLLCFPSVDKDLYFKYKKGEKISGQVKS